VPHSYSMAGLDGASAVPHSSAFGPTESLMKSMTEPRMSTVSSKDRTPIAYWRSGEGPPLLLVHATTSDHTSWDVVQPAFAEHFTVYAMDRRGRGGSGDGATYAVDREFEDVAALVDHAAQQSGAPVYLVAHSYGAFSLWKPPVSPPMSPS